MTSKAKRYLIGAAGLIVAAVAMAAMVIGPVSAQEEEMEVRLPFGPVGIARGQTAVLNVALVAVPPSPCRVTLSFYDRAGRLLGSREEPAVAEFTLEEPNVIVSLELPAVQALGEEQTRAEILPAVQLPPNPCRDLVSTLEVFDAGGRTSVLVHPGELVGLNPQPEPPS
jgi:hypothetical protein